MKYEPRKVFILESGSYQEITYQEYCRKRQSKDSYNRQGKRNDLTSRPVGEKLNSVEMLSKDVNDSARQIHRYIRLTELISPILDMVDEGQIAMRPAVELSYLPKE